MNRRELNETIQEIKDYYNAENYGQVVQCADKINLKKVREAKVLDIIGTSYEQCGENDKAFELFNFIYEKYGASRQMAFKLCELSVKKGDLDGAVEYYNDFCRIAPHDSARFLLKYEIGKAGNIERRELIKVLESYVSKEKDEKWEFELAQMYHDAGLENNCVKLCDDIFTWFADGEYVKKALQLKNMHRALSPEQQKRYDEMMVQRIFLDNPGRYVINGTEEVFETSSHIETFEASNEKPSVKGDTSDDYDEADEISNTLVMSAEAVNREIDRADDAPRITRFGTEPEAEDDEPLDEEMTVSLTKAIAANTRETEKAAILEAVLKAQELSSEGQNENSLFNAMEEGAEKEPAETANVQAVSNEPESVVSEPEPAANEFQKINAAYPGVVKLEPAQALKLGASELSVSPLAAYVSKPDLRTELPVRQGKAEHQPEKAVVLTSDEGQNDEIWLDSEVLFVPQLEDEVQDEDNLPEEYNDEETWEESPGPGPKLTKMADVSNIPMESSVDGQIGINLDMLTDDSEGIEGQMTIDEVFEQYAQKVKENESKYAEIEAERLRQIQEAVSGMVPTPLYEIEDEPEPDSPTKDVTMNVTELFSSGKAIEQMLKTAEDDEAKPMPEEYNDEDLSAIREINIEEEINKRNAGKAVSETGAAEEVISETVIPEAEMPEEVISETVIPEAEMPKEVISETVIPEAEMPEEVIFETIIPEGAVQAGTPQAAAEPAEDDLTPDSEADILEAIEAGLRATVEAEISAVKAEMSEPSQQKLSAAEEQSADLAAAEKAAAERAAAERAAAEKAAAEKAAAERAAAERAAAERAAAEKAAAERAAAEKAAEERAAAEKAAADQIAETAAGMPEEDDSDAELEELLAMLDRMEEEKASDSDDASDIESALAEAFAKEMDLESEENTEEETSEDDFDRLFSEFESENNKSKDISEDNGDLAAILAGQIDTVLKNSLGQQEKENAGEQLAAEKAAAEKAAAEEAAAEGASAVPVSAAAPAAPDDFDTLLAAFDAGSGGDDEDIPDFENVGAAIESKLAEESIKAEAETEAEKFIKEMQEDTGSEEEKPEETLETGNTIRLSNIDEIMAALLGETTAPDASETEEESDAAAEEKEETEEIPADLGEKPVRDDGFELSDDLRKDLEEFLFIDGMEEAICDAVVGISERKKNGDATGGNLIITGDSKTGKTYLAVNIIKAVTGEIGGGVEKVAKVQAQALNGKNIDKVFERIGASDLIIENVGFLGDETIQEIITSIKEGKPKGMVVMEGNQLAVENIFYTFPEAKKLFQARVDINELNIVQWSELACKYAETRGYIIDDMAQLALHARINEINLPTVRLGYGDITKIVDSAIQKADKRNVGKIFSAFSHKHGDGMKEIIEADFE